MSSSERVLFPCPKCGTGRGKGGIPCKQCGWDPDVVHVPIKPKPKSKPYSKFTALLIGFLSMLPIAYIFFFIAVIMVALSGESSQGSFNLLLIIHFAVIILSWSLLGFYIYYLFKTDHVQQDQKALWAVVLFLGNMIAMPIFWYLYIWKPTENAT